jgi:hypothetical protein
LDCGKSAIRKTPPEGGVFCYRAKEAENVPPLAQSQQLPVAMMMAPMAVMPIVPMPVAMMPAPVTVMPVAVVMPAAVVVPAHLFRPDPIDFVLRYESWLRTATRVNRRRCSVHRRYRGGLRGGGKQGGDRNKSKSEFQQKVPAFHHIDPFSVKEKASFPVRT